VSISVREATKEDWPAVAALLGELGRPAVLGREDEAAFRAIYDRYVERPDTVALVAVDDDGRVIGFVDMELIVRLNFLEPMAWIPDAIVTESERSRGAGHALLERAEQIARERGARWMSLESANWRTRAHAFYAREGWTDVAKSFARPLLTDIRWPPPPPEERD
jgi:GNAT superfamily N-acetyltransferase